MSFVPFEPRPYDGIWIAAAALLVSFLATIYPARNATRITPEHHARLKADLLQPGAILGFDGTKPLLRIVHQVHLIDQHCDLPDTQQLEQVTVTPGVFLHAFLGVDQQQCGLRLRCPGHHVLDELPVSRRIDDHVAPLRRAEPDLRSVDADVLVALGLQCVH